MYKSSLISLVAFTALLVSACGGGRAPVETPQSALAPPSAAWASADACARGGGSAEALVAYRMVEGRCLHSFTGLDAGAPRAESRRRILATAAASLSITDLFDWAERAYPQYFPSHQTNRLLATYTYRYYPETQNHVAVNGDLVYVQGPISDGALLYVGTLASFTCSVFPQNCTAPRPCTSVEQWSVGANVCTPNADLPKAIDSGTSYTFVDSVGLTQGSVTYACSDAVLTQKGLATCERPAPLACNISGLSWKVGVNTCNANVGEPTQLASGASHTFLSSADMVGSAAYTCNDGVLSATGVPVCDKPVLASCVPVAAQTIWSVGALTCLPDVIPAVIADGASFTFTDTLGDITGSDAYMCKAGVLQRTRAAVCEAVVHVPDSFGGDGGTADGGANGDGTAGDGAPIVGGLVRVVDTTGRQATATTNSQGYYRVKLTGMVPPLVISVTRTDGVVRRSLSTQALKINAYIFMALTGLTDKIASDVARSAGFSGAASLTPAIVAAQPQAVTAAVNALRNDSTISAALTAAGLTPATFDALYTPFRANGTGYDKVLDNLVITTDSTGATVVKSVDCAAPRSWTVGNATCTPDEGQVSVIPSGTTVIFHDRISPTLGTAGFSCVKSVLSAPILPSCK